LGVGVVVGYEPLVKLDEVKASHTTGGAGKGIPEEREVNH
jgi:hypothetical protein